jgi:RNA recognition motif-containing protein
MYQLFTPYGNLLSVRIMVEKDTGRSRGFGFVSYDAPESAAMAIKELNGFPVRLCDACVFVHWAKQVRGCLLTDHSHLTSQQIGNKRLKVQHKQIRRQDLLDQDSLQDSFGGNYQSYPSLPPSGPNANQHLWFDTARSTELSDESQEQQELEQDDVGADLDDTSPPRDEVGGADTDDNKQASPLANFSQLQNALPDIPGNGSQE